MQGFPGSNEFSTDVAPGKLYMLVIRMVGDGFKPVQGLKKETRGNLKL
jgi:hypothetical protein